MSQRSEPIAIIGSGCRFPGNSSSPSKLWDLLHEPRDLLTKIPADRFNAEAFYHPDPTHHGTANVQDSYFLSEDPQRFDAQFFGIQPLESDSIDPQQRMLLETVYESISAAGLTIEGLQGSSTAVYVGLMCDDWSGILTRDWDTFPTYTATGMARSIISNRVSYFFDWHGPSMTIDTACSSSLVAVHQAIQTLRSGESEVAIAAGANLILSPGMYIAESKLHMLSPTGRSRMWDKDADGYARGEGLAAVVLKTLSSALRDGDHIECIIRETGLNQDGRTTGITMPSNVAQTDLIQQTYAKAGLDINNVNDRPQFFYAHGTGTPAGDPQEAEAISKAFFARESSEYKKLYVGSIKTIIGHSEGTAGLASLIGASLAVQHGVIIPNMHFNELSDKVAPFYHKLEIPTEAKRWPAVPHGQPRRASVNSFGFGGSNAHAIIESYEHEEGNFDQLPLITPLTFSAASERTLQATLVLYSEFLKANECINLRNLAWTLQSRRSALPFKTTVSGMTIENLCSEIDSRIAQSEESNAIVGVRSLNPKSSRILGVFTGQGAQWPAMGRELIMASPHVCDIIAMLDRSLAELPNSDRPLWSIKDELVADGSSSRLADAAVSQPLCTAVQIVLVDLLRSAGIQLQAVVGHSSGEIGAAYAAGYISAYDAIRIAYYRGLYAKLAQSPNREKGAMLAVGTSFEDALGFCELETFQGRLVVAASNSSASVTISGDESAVGEAIDIFKDEQKFARKLNVDTAYHSFHMEPCSEPYNQAISKCMIKVEDVDATPWFSSVVSGQRMTKTTLTDKYWMDNMINPVMFSDAVTNAVLESGPFDLVLEIGPHPALKTPCLTNIEEASGVADTPYCGLLSRGKNDVEAFSAALGFVWMHLGSASVNFDAYEKLASSSVEPKRLVTELPTYPWDRHKTYWTESRISGAYRVRKEAPHSVLGAISVESTTPQEIQWRNILRPKEVGWLNGHKLQGQTVFPASGYVVMAVEAAMTLADNQKIRLIEIQDLLISRAMTFKDDATGVETLFTLKIVLPEDGRSQSITADFTCYSCLQSGQPMSKNASGRVLLHLGDTSLDSLPSTPSKNINMVDLDVERFYSSLTKLGYNYSYPFRGISAIQRKVDSANGTLVHHTGTEWEDNLMIHPGMLDTALQTIFAAYCSPGDERLWSLHVPTSIQRITINPYFCFSDPGKETIFPFQSTITSEPTADLGADVEIFSEGGEQVFIQVESVCLVPFSRASPENDSCLFSKFVWNVATADGELAAQNEHPSDYEKVMAYDLERVSFFYLRFLAETITPQEKEQTLLHYQRLLDWASHVVEKVCSGKHLFVKPECQTDTHDQIVEIISRYRERVDVRLIEVVGENLPAVIRNRGNILEFMAQDGLLSNFYEEGMGLMASNRWIGRMARQIAHRYPHMRIFEIGAGTGGATRAILGELGSAFSSYTYTDISSAFFETAQERFERYAGRMIFKTFDMEKSVVAQGYIEESYDMIIASNVLHATKPLEETMKNTRRLLKPGGHLLLLEVVNNEPLRNGLPMGGLPGWWIGADSGRPWGPTLSLLEWDSLLRRTGFSGIDTATPDYDSIHPFSVFATQAVDDRVRLLRKPLSMLPAATALKLEDLVIIGGRTLQTSRIAEDVIDLLAPRFKNITRIKFIEDLENTNLSASSAVLSLTELDEPLLEHVTAAKIECLKVVFTQARSMLWVTRGCRADEPHSNMMVGLGRGLRFEYPNINLQMLDIDKLDEGSPHLFATSLLCLQAVDAWKREKPLDDLLWSMEPEVVVEGGSHTIPRLMTNQAQNDRYNSSRRLITRDIDPQTSTVKIVSTESCYELRGNSLLKPWPFSDSPGKTTLRVSHSLLQSIRIETTGYLFLCLGSVVETGESVLALSERSESVVQVPTEWTVRYTSQVDHSIILLSVASNLLAQKLISITPMNGTLLVHEPDGFLIPALEKQAADKNITFHYTTTNLEQKATGGIYIHPLAPQRMIKRAIPGNASLFVDLSMDHTVNDIGNRIAECLPGLCGIDATPFFSNGPTVRPCSLSVKIGTLLKAAWDNSKALRFEVGTLDAVVLLPLKDVSSHTGTGEPASIVNWTISPTVPVKTQPVDSEDLFRSDRTYLLVGLSGEVGQSLCQWMVDHGARYVVLTSRNPKVSKEWIESLEAVGATIKALSLDITNRQSLHAVYNEICRTLPPVAGVANGAMVLLDKMFDNMELDDMVNVLKPKVEGSKYLDELFPEDTLDFFVLFSSITAVVGNSGQSNYIAANMFMTGLAFQRKKRGLAGSVIDISSLVGIGYVERSETFDAEYFSKIGYTNISEQDLHQMFAEAILAGRPGSHESAEIVTGFAPAYADAEIKAPYRHDLKFCHYIIERPWENQLADQVAVIPVTVQLSTAKTKDQVFDILKECFTSRLQQILQIPAEDKVSETMTLIEQGVDSLVAVEVRSWFLKELDIDMPVLKVLGGASIADLVEDAVDRLPSKLVPKLDPSNKSISTPTVEIIKNEQQIIDGFLEVGLPSVDSVLPLSESEKSLSLSGSETHATSIVDSGEDAMDRPKLDSSSKSLSGPIVEKFKNEQQVKDSFFEEGSFSSESALSLSGSRSSLVFSDSETHAAVLTPMYPPEITEKMSFGQSRFWFLNHFLQDQTTFNMAFSVRLEGHLRVPDLEKAVRIVAQKHEALATRFFSAGSHMEQPMQGILQSSLVHLRQKSITHESQATQELDDMRAHVWNLEHWETMRITLLSLSKTTHILIIGCHHIAMDGLSFQIFFADLEKAYMGQTLSPCPADSQYRAFSALQHQEYDSGKMDADLDFYRGIIPSDPKPLPLFPFARTTSRKILDSYDTHRADFRLDSVLTTRIKDRSRKHKATTFHFYLATLQSLIFRFLKDIDDFFIGIADANRTDSKFMGTLGFFLNLLPLRFQRRSAKTFSDAVRDARTKVYSALSHSKLPFDVLLNRFNIARSAMHTPLFQVFVDYRQGVQERTTFAGCEAKGESWHIAKTGYDMALDIIENAAGDSLLTLRLQKSLYSSSDTKMLLQSYVNLLTTFSMTPEVSLEVPSLWQKVDIDRAIELGRGRTMESSWPPTLSHRVDAMVREHGGEIAIKDGADNTLTYSQMAERVNSIATSLVAALAVDGAKVAVFQEPTSDWICSLLAIFRVGAVYVPLDLRTPLPRLATIVQKCRPRTILAHGATVNNTPALEAPNATIIDISSLPTSDSKAMPNRAIASSPAVIIFTSGSTGTPKGIVIDHSSLKNQMESYSKEYSIAAGAGMVLQQSAFSFDFSIDQIFSALSNGGGLYVVPAAQRGDPLGITKLMAAERITYTSATPSEYLMWTRYGATNLALCSKWRYAFAGGEPLAEVLVQEFQKLGLPGLRFFNNYGPAEITVASTKIEIPYNEMTAGEPIPAGFMLPNYSVYIVDEHLKPVPAGFPGEIVIGGAGVSSGYLDDHELTKQKFIPDPFATTSSAYMVRGWHTMYRTGDRGRMRDDGALMCEGRIDGDTQIKLRGLRIELEDIENTILHTADGALISTVVSVRGQADSQFLVAHVVFSQTYQIDGREAFLNRLPSLLPLPQYMVPAVIIPLDNLLLTNHFKIDRLAIKALPIPTAVKDTDSTELTETESRLRLLWQEVLPFAPAIAANSDFFHIGGNSLLLVKLQAMVRDSFDVALRLVDLMNTGTLGLMASVIQESRSIHNIDWAVETALPESLLQSSRAPEVSTSKFRQPSDNLVILLTGSTGHLGRHLLPRLVADSRISKIYCVAVRESNVPIERRLFIKSDKIMIRSGDLGLPLLGLADGEFSALASEVDLIIHSGANRSFWDNYETLRPSNVSPIKELVKLALPRKVPIHFLSSGAVLQYSLTTPPTDGTDGYVATKWAAERYLSNASEKLGLPVYIHQPLSAAGISTSAPPEILDELSRLGKQMKMHPSFDMVQGHIDLIPMAGIIDKIHANLFEDPPSQSPRFVLHESYTRVAVRSFVDHLEKNVDMDDFERMPALEWVGAAKQAGFSYFIASQSIAMGSNGDHGDNAVGFVSKR